MVPIRMFILPKWFDESPHVKVDANTDLQLPELKARCVACINAAHDEWFKQSQVANPDGGSIFLSTQQTGAAKIGAKATDVVDEDTPWIEKALGWIEKVQTPKSLHATHTSPCGPWPRELLLTHH